MEETKEIGYRGSALPVPDFRNHCDGGALSGADDFCDHWTQQQPADGQAFPGVNRHCKGCACGGGAGA